MMNQTYAQTHQIVWNDIWQQIEVNGYVLNLSPTQYRILHLFAEAQSPTVSVSAPDEMVILAYQSRDTIEGKMALSWDLLARHISFLNTRLMATGLRLCFFQGGYLLTLKRA